ncbi:hypothetical protein JIN85_11175 [Luteolibacter pohnpeiensis]|uniref:Uncharacterized protein n=1 Tax=Luteolibacter pohnpeiensis TaxID=454153 RepID=A0A934VW70_9BACT|nr:hypothetical protein [Luteolibacter pohnpeiensis]MBK1882980.1 hypothetical protein [Luteolibacter pohnpeiensis]
MISHSWKVGLISGIGGLCIGWLAHLASSSSTDSTDSAAEMRSSEPIRRQRERENQDAKTAARWIDRLEHDELANVTGEIPTEDFHAVLAGIMNNVWGKLSNEDYYRLQALIDEWAQRDSDGALAWVRSLRQPQQRSAGLSCIAAALAETDPQRAFDIYTEQDTVYFSLGREKLLKLITDLSQEATAAGPKALIELWKRIPKNGTNGTMGFSLNYPDGFDYAEMMDLMANEGIGLYQQSGDSNDKPIEPTSPLAEWAVKDPNAAFDYLVEKLGSGMRLDAYWSLTGKMKEKWGNEATQVWLGQQFASLDTTQRSDFLKGTMMLNYPGQLKSMIDHIPDPSTAQEARYEAMQAGIEKGLTNFDILTDLPTDQKLEVIERLRGYEDTNYLEKTLINWDIPRDRIDAILQHATEPNQTSGTN